MVRNILILLTAAILCLAGATRAADPPPAGNWKITIFGDRPQTPWLIQLANKDGKWTGTLLAVGERFPKFTLEGFTFANERLRFTLHGDDQTFAVDAKVPKEAAKVIKGSISMGGDMVPCQLTATTLTTLKAFDVRTDMLANEADNPNVFMAGLELLSMAGDNKAKPEEVRGWAEKLWKAAEPYGVRWQQQTALATADVLSQEKEFTAIALAYAQRAERLLEPQDSAQTKQRVYTLLVRVLEKAGKSADAKEVQARVAKLEGQVDEEYLKKMPPFKVQPFAGRKGKSTRAVLAELFTGSQCGPCVAADMAFDGLLKTYKPTDVVLVEYHVHVPGPDPLTNLDTEARLEYYNEEIEGTPALLLNGKLGFGKGGPIGESEKVYNEYRKRTEPLLEQDAQAALELTAQRRGNKIDITGEATDVANPGENVRLRFALLEETARYVGSNGIRYHHHVVRAMPGGDKGFALKEKKTRQSVSVDLTDLKKQLTQYINVIAKKSKANFPEPESILALKNLRVVAFVQNDKTKEILQAKQVDVSGGKE